MDSSSTSITSGLTAWTTVTEVVVPRLRSSLTGCRKGSYFPWCEALPPTPTPGPGSPPTSPLPAPCHQPSTRLRAAATRSPGPRRDQGWLDSAGSSARPPERTALDTVTSPRRRARSDPARRTGVGRLCALPYESRADPQSTKQPDHRFTRSHAAGGFTASGHTASCGAALFDAGSGGDSSRPEQRRCIGSAGHSRGGRCRQGPSTGVGPCAGGLTGRRRTGGSGRSTPRGGPDDAQPRAPSHRRRADRRRSPVACACRYSERRTANWYAGSIC